MVLDFIFLYRIGSQLMFCKIMSRTPSEQQHVQGISMVEVIQSHHTQCVSKLDIKSKLLWHHDNFHNTTQLLGWGFVGPDFTWARFFLESILDSLFMASTHDMYCDFFFFFRSSYKLQKNLIAISFLWWRFYCFQNTWNLLV